MKGTEKQIKFANNIKMHLIRLLNFEKSETIRRIEDGSLPDLCLEIIKEIIDPLISGIENQDDAKFIIETLYDKQDVFKAQYASKVKNFYIKKGLRK